MGKFQPGYPGILLDSSEISARPIFVKGFVLSLVPRLAGLM
jgi:hypothetical protein